ncbi:MAG: hypothetical protein RJA10_1903, partial [Pseudomonadota bacterium]
MKQELKRFIDPRPKGLSPGPRWIREILWQAGVG